MTPELIAVKSDDRIHFSRSAGCQSFPSFRARRSRQIAALLLMLLLGASCADLGVSAELGRIGVTVTDLGNPFFVRVARGVEGAARRILGPKATVYVVSSAYDLNRQEEQINSFMINSFIKGKVVGGWEQ